MEFTYAFGNYLISACSENKGSLSVEAKQLTVISTLNVCVRNDEEKIIELERKKKNPKNKCFTYCMNCRFTDSSLQTNP